MERVLVWRALARAGMMTAALIMASTAQAAGPENKTRAGSHARPSQPAAPATAPLHFFTIAQRVTALRASGGLPAAPQEPVLHHASLPIAESEASDPGPALRRTLPRDPDAILGLAMLPVPGGELAEKWRDMAIRWQRDAAIVEACRRGAPCDHEGAKRWIRIGETAAALSGRPQLALVHASINRAIRYATDYQSGAAADHWASPLESVDKMGDCEDYAIAKYMLLRSLGYRPADLKLIVLFQRSSGMFHAILAARSEGEWLFLDNQRQDLARASDYADTRPIAALDEDGQAMLAILPRPVPQPVQRVALLEPTAVEPAAPDLP